MIRLSHNIDEHTPTYGNRNKFIAEQQTVNPLNFFVTESKWIFETNHLGTHIDVPKHFLKNGMSLTDFDDSFWLFEKFELIDIPKEKGVLIEFHEIEEQVSNNNLELLLIRTGYEKFRESEKYWQDNPGISSKCAAQLKEKFPLLRGIGFDFISLTSFNYRDDGKQAHYNLFKDNKPFIIIEDMKLSLFPRIKSGRIVVSPLFVANSDGSPVTVFLM